MPGKFDRFEELGCWQSARRLVKVVYLACLESKLKKDCDMQSQLKRAALSSQNNIAEGFCRYYKKSLSDFLIYPRVQPEKYSACAITWKTLK